MAERPILFSGPMVRAILDGKKSQTRRIVKPQATDIVRATGNVNPVYIEDDGFWYYRDPDDYSAHDTQYRLLKPTWAVGDRLWVKETHFLELPGDLKWDAEGLRVSEWPEYLKTQCVVHYKQGCDLNDPEAWCWKSSIFMPRWASRIELVVTEVRVERLQDISEGDAIAEGVICTYRTAELVDKGDGPRFVRRPTAEYEALWDSIYGPGSWDANPYVWVISFEVARG